MIPATRTWSRSASTASGLRSTITRSTPLARSETCARCGDEVRYGRRGDVTGWLHRDEVDHAPVFGVLWTAEQAEEMERQRHVPRVRYDKDGSEVVYTTAQHDLAKMKKAKREEARQEEEGDYELEPVQVYSTPLPLKGRMFVGCPDGSMAEAAVPGGARTIINLADRIGWRVDRLTYSRGPFIGASGVSLGISDYVVLRVRLDEGRIAGVASWRDGKSTSAWKVENHRATQTGARDLIAWMKEHPHG